MDAPHVFAGRVIKRGGKQIENDFSQPEKFFIEMRDFLNKLNGVPLSAVEDLEKYDSNRDVLINIIRQCLKILDRAGLNVIEEISRMDADPFDGLEEELELRKKNAIMKISGESEE